MRRRLAGWGTGFLAATVEAWHELRIHKLRVLLSLVGVMVAVASLTAALAAASIGKQVLVEQYERDGRPAFIRVMAYDMQSGMSAPPDLMRPAMQRTAERFGISHVSVNGSVWDMRASLGDREVGVELGVIDPPYATMHRLLTNRGRWLERGDAQNMSPAVVVEQRLLDKLGLGDRPLPVTVDFGSRSPATVTVVGTVPRQRYADQPRAFMLADAYEQWFVADQPLGDATYEMWVPVENGDTLADEVGRALAAELGSYQVDSYREDYLVWGDEDPFKEVALAVGAIAGVILLLGALSLLNVALVTIQQRVREVGIRRSFGATTGRVFFSVMMESVVATAVAGAAGVLLAVALVNSPWTAKYLLEGVDDVPPFPVDAALLGLAVSVGVGVLAGVLPAIVAARVKIIDAIRF